MYQFQLVITRPVPEHRDTARISVLLLEKARLFLEEVLRELAERDGPSLKGNAGMRTTRYIITDEI